MADVVAVPARDLTPEQWHAWERLRQTNPQLRSPHFSSRFLQHVAAVREGVEVAIVEKAGEIVAFLPFCRSRGGMAGPVAGLLSDLQGAIAAPDWQCDARTLVRECGLACFSFSQLLASQAPFGAFHVSARECPFVDLRDGFESYCAERRRARSHEFREALRKGRKIQREVGPLRLVPHSKEEAILDVLLGWKEEQLRARGRANMLSRPWMRELLGRIHREQSESLSGMLTVLFVGDELAAASMGMRSEEVVAGWVTAYSPRFHRYSPGLLLLVELARAAEALGIRRIDMGPGGEPYKQSFRSGGIPLAEGSVAVNPLLQLVRTAELRARAWFRLSPLSEPVRTVADRLRLARAPRRPAQRIPTQGG